MTDTTDSGSGQGSMKSIFADATDETVKYSVSAAVTVYGYIPRRSKSSEYTV